MIIEIPFLLALLVVAIPLVTTYLLSRQVVALGREMAVNRRRIMALEAVRHD